MNHRIFERTLRLLVFRKACLFECHETSIPSGFLPGVDLDLGACLGWLALKALVGRDLWAGRDKFRPCPWLGLLTTPLTLCF